MRPQAIGVSSLIALLITFGIEQDAAAQSTVQLPSISTFTYSGSVLVPTGGSTSLGGVSRSATRYRSRRGAGHGFGGGVAHAGAAAHVTIIDHDAIDRQIRGLPPRDSVPSATRRTRRPTATGIASHPDARASAPDAKGSDPDAEGKALVRFARKQFLAGKRTSSFDAYQLAIQTLSPKLAELAKAEFSRVFPSRQRPIHFQFDQVVLQPPAAD